MVTTYTCLGAGRTVPYTPAAEVEEVGEGPKRLKTGGYSSPVEDYDPNQQDDYDCRIVWTKNIVRHVTSNTLAWESEGVDERRQNAVKGSA